MDVDVDLDMNDHDDAADEDHAIRYDEAASRGSGRPTATATVTATARGRGSSSSLAHGAYFDRDRDPTAMTAEDEAERDELMGLIMGSLRREVARADEENWMFGFGASGAGGGAGDDSVTPMGMVGGRDEVGVYE